MIKKCYVIPVEKMCNSNCVFCISKVRNYNKECEFLSVDNCFLDNLVLLKKRGIKKFEVTGGGEPFLNSQLEDIVNAIRSVIIDAYIKVYTNGNIVKYVGDVDELNISVVHYDAMINSKFMGVKGVSLLDKLKFFREIYPGVKLRLSIPLIKGAIDSKHELESMINLTSDYVNGYVVRTLYKGTNDIQKLYVDFNYDNSLVVFERDNDVSDFSSIILWSDGNMYTNWSLNDKRYLYSYILLKSDARSYVCEIENIIVDNGFSVVKRYLLDDFYNQSLGFYRDKNVGYLKTIKKHLESISYLFGNQGLVYLLDKECSIGELVSSTFELKNLIRSKYSFTHSLGGVLKYNDGNFTHLNLVHAPDACVDIYNKDINYLLGLDNVRLLNEEEFSLVKKYRSFYL